MKYVTSFERFAIERGLEQGLQQGLQQGRQEGQAALLQHLLARRFGPVPEAIAAQMAGATQDQLQTWADRVLDARTLDEVFKGH